MAENILIVDDEAPIRKLLRIYLAGAGYECHEADSAESARASLATQRFDLILSDLKMPSESGVNLLYFAKENYPETGRVVITGFGSSEVSSEVIHIGVYGYIIKPVTQNEILITVKNALEHLRFDCHMHDYKLELENKISGQLEKTSAIMNNLIVGVAMFDRSMCVVEFNRKMHLWFPEICPGRIIPCSEAIICLRNDYQCSDSPMMDTFRTGSTGQTQRRISTAQGEREFRIVASPVFDNHGNVYAGVALFEDITEQLVLERNLRLAQKFEAVGKLAAGIAHEINTPIQYIGDNVSFLKTSFDDMSGLLDNYAHLWQEAEERKEVPAKISQKFAEEAEKADIAYLREEIPKTFDQTLEGVRRVEKIVRAMKDFSHPGDDEKTTVNINKILESTITVCRNEWKYVAEMETALAPDLQLVPCFAGEISQVFLNIIVNAAHAISDFSEGGKKGKGKICIKTGMVNSHIQIRISDTGGGIPKEIQDRVFDPFFTTKVQGKGTGQGLAIAHRVVIDKHQGNLLFETEKGRGTTFVIELPVF